MFATSSMHIRVSQMAAAIAAGLTDELLSMQSLCAIMNAENPPKKHGPHKKAV
jgi:hypothetical protein